MNDRALDLYDRIVDNRKHGRHVNNYHLINQYFQTDYAVFDWILDTYIISLVKKRKFEEAIKYLKILSEKFPDYLSDFSKICLYISCEDYDTVYNLLNDENIKLSGEEYLKIGIRFLSNGLCSMALKCFEEGKKNATSNSVVAKCDEYIERIGKYFNDQVFLRQEYKHFEENGGMLQPGLIISGFVNNKGSNSKIQAIANKRLHVILEMKGTRLYCVPLLNANVLGDSKKYKFQKYVLTREEYPVLGRDCIVTDKIECIFTDKVFSVYGRILPEDYYDIYQMVTTSREEYINSKKLFKIKK